MLTQLKGFADCLKRQLSALHFAVYDPRTPWAAKVLAFCVLGYALSPIDLIPDFIPILGYLDDLVLVPLGIYFAIKLIPRELWADCQVRASKGNVTLPRSHAAAVAIVVAWVIATLLLAYLLVGKFFRE